MATLHRTGIRAALDATRAAICRVVMLQYIALSGDEANLTLKQRYVSATPPAVIELGDQMQRLGVSTEDLIALRTELARGRVCDEQDMSLFARAQRAERRIDAWWDQWSDDEIDTINALGDAWHTLQISTPRRVTLEQTLAGLTPEQRARAEVLLVDDRKHGAATIVITEAAAAAREAEPLEAVAPASPVEPAMPEVEIEFPTERAPAVVAPTSAGIW